MKRTYAVKWREPDGGTYVGRLALGANALHLDGRPRDGQPVERQLAYEDLRALRIGHLGADRLDDQPTLIVDGSEGTYQVASTVMRAGILQELMDRLAGLRLEAPRRATIVLPLREGSVERVRELAAAGPPFDPEASGLARHQLLLTSHEAIFVFEALGDDGLEALLGELDVWAAAATWRELVAGPPRLAEAVYAWERPEQSVTPAIGLGL